MLTHFELAFLPFNHYSNDDDFKDALMSFFNYNVNDLLNRLNNMIFNPFEINENYEVSPLFDIDPDFQFYNDMSIQTNIGNCDYYTDDTFNKKFVNSVEVNNYFSVLHINIRSAPKNLHSLEVLLSNLSIKFSVIGLSETWFTELNLHHYGINSYNCEHKIRQERRGGGVSLFIDDNIDYKIRSDLDVLNDNVESIFIEISKDVYSTNKDLIIGQIYRPPNTDMLYFNNFISELLNTVNTENKILYLLGDYNINLLNSDQHLLTSEFVENMYSYSTFPLITKPTRIQKDSATLIDNIFFNDISNSSLVNGILFTDISDHFPIFSIDLHCSFKISNYKKFRLYNESNIAKFCENIESFNWQPIINASTFQEAFSSFYNVFKKQYYDCFPEKISRSRYYNRKPWLSNGLKISIKIKNQLYLTSKKNPNEENILNYRNYRNYLNKLLRTAEKNHYDNIFKENKHNLKKSWGIIKSLINKNKQKRIPKEFIINNTKVTNENQIANAFNKFYVNIGPSLASNISNTDIDPTSYINVNIPNSIILQPTNIDELKAIITNLKNNSPGKDEIQAGIIKKTFTSFAEPLIYLINLSLQEGTFPSELKLAKVIPIYKSGNCNSINNYRPVSILSTFSKIFERVMYTRLLNFISNEGILYKYQFGFRENHNSTLALMTLLDEIYDSFNKNEYVIGVFLDFKKAFDTIDHSILLKKIFKYGIRGKAYNWIKSYLENRSQYVSYNNYYSTEMAITCGVPQGSILGPFLFILYINDIFNISPNILPILFADDTNLFFKGKNLQNMKNIINSELHHVNEWLVANKLSLNTDKTKFMVFSPSNKNSHENDINIRINNVEISQVNCIRFLGVIIDSKLNWADHINMIKTKVSKAIGIIYKTRKLLDKCTLVTLYYSFVYPYLMYNIENWGMTFNIYLDSLFKLHKKVVSIICCVNYRDHTEPLFHNLKILPLSKIFAYQIMNFMFKAYKNILPLCCHDKYNLNSSVHRHQTRSSSKFHIPFMRLKISQRSVKYIGPKLWNYYCTFHDLSKITTYYTFKRKIHCIIQQNEVL